MDSRLFLCLLKKKMGAQRGWFFVWCNYADGHADPWLNVDAVTSVVSLVPHSENVVGN